MIRTTWFMAGLLLTTAMMEVISTSAADGTTRLDQQLPDPDTKKPSMDRPIQVFIMMGQSNMLGFGRVGPEDQKGTLENLVRKEGRYPHLIDDQGNWTQREDVRYVQVMHRNGKMAVLRNDWLTVTGRHIGVELQFGHILGHVLEEPVLLLKSCIGNRSLGWDLLPPGSRQFEFEGRIYAGYRESPLSWEKGTEPEPIGWYAGKQYDDDVASAKAVLEHIGEYYPGGQRYEVAGFVWWQGHKDQNPAHAGRYEQNLVRLIKSVRKDFHAPDAKFVLATIAFGGWDLQGPGLTVADAQLAVSGETGKYPEFKGNVRTVEARDFWRDKNVSPSGAGHHYNHNAETYMEVGNALGWAMAGLLTGNSISGGSQRDVKELQESFRELQFGMFIHYNMATYKGVQWVAGYPNPSDFNPAVDTIDTDAWADAAVSAGMKYGVLTAKHVGGFCLWDSRYTKYDVMHPDCPYQKDLVAQFIESFKSRGLKVGLYYAWRHPGFKDEFKVLPPECDPATHSMDEQIAFQKKQIAELVEKYPDVFYLWNDALDPRIMPAEEAKAFFRGLRSDVLTSSNWWDWGKKGTPYVDIAVKELRHFPADNSHPGETCWCLEQKWFWNEGARSKTAKRVVDLLTTASSRNSNFLLNVGPDRNGRIVDSSLGTLAEVGELLATGTAAD